MWVGVDYWFVEERRLDEQEGVDVLDGEGQRVMVVRVKGRTLCGGYMCVVCCKCEWELWVRREVLCVDYIYIC